MFLNSPKPFTRQCLTYEYRVVGDGALTFEGAAAEGAAAAAEGAAIGK
jgi:hypothetical protein